MTNRLASAVCTLLIAAVAAAQNDEADFNQRQAKALNAFAKKAFDKGFPRQARLIWLQVTKLYDPENAEAWEAIGYAKVGNSWNPRSGFTYPTADTGTGAEGNALFRSYEQLKKDLANQHRQQAEKWGKAGRTDRANHHWQLVLRFAQGDEQAQKALDHREVGAVTGTGLEQTLFERSKMIETAVEQQAKSAYEVKRVDGIESKPVVRAQVTYITVQSDHFTLHGDPEEEQNLMDALQWAERALQVCKVAFPWPVPEERWRVEWAMFAAKETYQQILKANQVPDLEWRLEHTATCGIGNTVVAATSGTQVMFDAAVRNVAQACAGFGSDGFREGIGHTFVGMVFNNNRLFAVDLKKQQGTTASEEDREYQSPDFDVWKTLNLELAWKSTGGVAARDLPFTDAAAFTNEQRIKAWSFCDYMMRRDPKLLADMDRLALELKAENQKQPIEFEKRFDGAHDVTVAQLDKEWEDFWTEASPVLKAIQNNTPPLAAVSKGVEKWLEAFNVARKEFGNTAPVTWSSNLSTRCHDHAQYLKKNKDERGPEKEHTQQVGLGGSYTGGMFAEMAIVETDASLGGAKKMFQRWLGIPGYRDALVHDFLLTVGIYVEGDILVMNVVSGMGKPRSKSSGYDCYPRRQGTMVPAEVAVADLGPELVELLEKHGKADRKTVGFPLTLHFGGSGGVQGNRLSYRCTVTGPKGERVEGALLFDDGKIRRTSAPGMVTFYPFEPLPRGSLGAVWSWESGGQQQQLVARFQTK